MTDKTTEALKLAKEALQSCEAGNWSMSYDELAVDEALATIREALAEPVKQKLVGVVEPSEEWGVAGVLIAGLPIGTKLYADPVSAEAIRAEALEEAAKVCRTAQAKGLQSIREAIEAAIRGLK